MQARSASFAEVLAELWHREDGQDLIEYCYLCAFVALAGIVVWQNVVSALALNYATTNTNVQNLWDMPNP